MINKIKKILKVITDEEVNVYRTRGEDNKQFICLDFGMDMFRIRVEKIEQMNEKELLHYLRDELCL